MTNYKTQFGVAMGVFIGAVMCWTGYFTPINVMVGAVGCAVITTLEAWFR